MKALFRIITFLFVVYCCLVTMSMVIVVALNYGETISWGFFFKWMVPPAVVIGCLASLHAENTHLTKELKNKN